MTRTERVVVPPMAAAQCRKSYVRCGVAVPICHEEVACAAKHLCLRLLWLAFALAITFPFSYSLLGIPSPELLGLRVRTPYPCARISRGMRRLGMCCFCCAFAFSRLAETSFDVRAHAVPGRHGIFCDANLCCCDVVVCALTCVCVCPVGGSAFTPACS